LMLSEKDLKSPPIHIEVCYEKESGCILKV
jgi:hypothetical protein